ncbi:stage II sporulation protein D [Neobacillus notoginsengisoli]|uniref:Stage II sporulation protein D n=1 Tax=Neobacillus notoginsengisoli TaxID=1578198 RepID=A0A417YRJ1_9BACI|nr:stage II sporulation protein D [Neobacillus notoginsengisoli]RHW37213.1 stage II sporulation protein D [Neobacillus notoginsengisoli]
MKNMKPFIALASFLFAVTLLIPALLVLPYKNGETDGKLGEQLQQAPKNEAIGKGADPAVEVAVYRTNKKEIEKLPLDKYLEGVVAAEMPAEFEKEALKAQALTARTYIVNQLLNKDKKGLPKGAQVSDTGQIHQEYKSDDELKRIWGSDYSWKKKKIAEAVKATGGQILTYNGRAIDASFFSTSNGFTENSEDYWQHAFPYLRSVESPWDKKSPKYKSQLSVSVADFEKKLGVKIGNSKTIGVIKGRTAGNRIGKVDFNGKILTGKQIREQLGLRSSDFSWERRGNEIFITTRGFGHGVGMSQYGANGMAAEGKTYEDIVKYYYQGVAISPADSMLATITAGK